MSISFEPFAAAAVLRRTPGTLRALLAGLPEPWLGADEGDDLGRTGMHPELGRVTAGQLLATWVVHDLGHIRQIARVMAKQYGGDVGPWREYLPVLSE